MRGSNQQFASPEEALAHFGVLGMRWGHHKLELMTPDSTHIEPRIPGSDHFPPVTADAVNAVNKKLTESYGFSLTHVVPMTPREGTNTMAYVHLRARAGVHVLHVQPGEGLAATAKELSDKGWLAPSGDHPVEALFAHESAHAMLHQATMPEPRIRDLFIAPVPHQPYLKARGKAWDAAKKQAIADGDAEQPHGLKRLYKPSVVTQMASKVSGYAHYSYFSQEIEAEMFSTYHYGPNPPRFVDAWMKEMHQQGFGKEVPPFSGRPVR